MPHISYGSGELTGLGLRNCSNYEGMATVFGYNSMGETEEVSLGPLSARSRMAVNFSGLLGEDNLWVQIKGETDFTTPLGTPPLHFQGLAVYWEEDTGKLGSIKLNALRFKDGFFGVVSTDPEPAFALLNPGTVDATIMVTAYNSDGEVLMIETIEIGAGSNMTGAVSELLGGVSLAAASYIRIVSDVYLYGFETINADGRMEILPLLK